MKKGSIIILSIVTILSMIVWFSCNPIGDRNQQSSTFNVLDETDMVKATGDNGCIGYGNATTGGEGGTTTTVTTWAALKAAVAGTSPKIVVISGAITGSGVLAPGPNTSIIGADANASLTSSTIYVSTADYDNYNIIIQNLTVIKPGTDGVTIAEGGYNVWVDHCTFVDCPDGAIDVSKDSHHVTISWCKFIYPSKGTHAFANLVSSSDDDVSPFYVTLHHNWYSDNTIERMPSVRNGQVHVFNNYYNAPGNNYCIRTRIAAQILAENNSFENVKNPWERYVSSGTPGKIKLSGNLTVNCTFVAYAADGEGNTREIPDGTDTVFTPPYAYTLESASTVKASVMAGAGPR
jgi:pectate lyase